KVTTVLVFAAVYDSAHGGDPIIGGRDTVFALILCVHYQFGKEIFPEFLYLTLPFRSQSARNFGQPGIVAVRKSLASDVPQEITEIFHPGSLYIYIPDHAFEIVIFRRSQRLETSAIQRRSTENIFMSFCRSAFYFTNDPLFEKICLDHPEMCAFNISLF